MHLLFHIHRLKSNLPKHAFAFKLAPFEGLIVTPPRRIPLKRKRSPTSLISTKIQISRHVITSVIIKMTDEVLLLCESRQDIYITEVLQTLQKNFSKTFEGLITEATLFAKQANLCQHFAPSQTSKKFMNQCKCPENTLFRRHLQEVKVESLHSFQ